MPGKKVALNRHPDPMPVYKDNQNGNTQGVYVMVVAQSAEDKIQQDNCRYSG